MDTSVIARPSGVAKLARRVVAGIVVLAAVLAAAIAEVGPLELVLIALMLLFALILWKIDSPAPAAASPRAVAASVAPVPGAAIGWEWWAAAVLLPIIGIIGAIIRLARNQVGPGLALLVTSVLAGAVWTALLSS